MKKISLDSIILKVNFLLIVIGVSILLHIDYNQREYKKNTLLVDLSLNSSPYPFWVKSIDSKVVYINKAYEKVILNPLGFSKNQFINTKGEILFKSGSKELYAIIRHDQLVLKYGKLMLFEESIPNFGNGMSYKWAVFDEFGMPIALAGMWMPFNEYLLLKNKI